jgi:hypothetical protein
MPRDSRIVTRSEAGARLYERVTDEYDLTAAEEEILFQACRVADRLERIDKELGSVASLVVNGSTGQQVAHPLLAAAAVQQRVLAALLQQLGLPDAEDAHVDLPEDVPRLLPRREAGAHG